MAANYHNTGLIDFITDPTGQTQKANTKALSDFVNGTLNGAILTPYNTVAQMVATIPSNNTVYLGDGKYNQLFNTAFASNALNITSDTLLLAILDWQDKSNFFKGSKTIVVTGCILTGEVGATKTLSDGVTSTESYVKCVAFSGESGLFSQRTSFKKGNVFQVSDTGQVTGITSSSTYEYKNNVLTAWYSCPISGSNSLDLPAGAISSNFFGIGFYLILTTGSGNPDNFFNEVKNNLFSPTSKIRYKNTAGVIVNYPSVADAIAANPTWLQGNAIGEIGWLGDHNNGEFIIERDSKIYTDITGFEHDIVRPGKAEYIINSATIGGTHTNTAFVSDRLTSTAASGFYEKEVVLQSTGLTNPIVFMSRGLDMTSHTPTANTLPNPENPAKLTFKADYKVVGGSYTGVYHDFCWNTPIGFDGDGTASGEGSFNPLTLVDLQIESLKIQIHVQQLANTAGTGIYGFYVAPKKENFCVKVLGNGIPLAGSTVTIDGVDYTTDSEGITDFVFKNTGVSFNYSATKLGYTTGSSSVSLAYDYTIKTLEIVSPPTLERNYLNPFSFVRFRMATGALISDLPIEDFRTIDI